MSLSHLIGGPTPELHGHHAMCFDAPNLDSVVLRLGERARVVLATINREPKIKIGIRVSIEENQAKQQS